MPGARSTTIPQSLPGEYDHALSTPPTAAGPGLPSESFSPELKTRPSARPHSHVAPSSTIRGWDIGKTIVVALGAAFLLYSATFVISLSFITTGARQLGYSMSPLEYTCTVLPYGERRTCVTQALVDAVMAGCVVVDVIVFAVIVLAVFGVRARYGRRIGLSLKACFVVVTGGSIVAAGIAPGVGVWLRPLDGFGVRQAFLAGGVGVVMFFFEAAVVLLLMCLLSCVVAVRLPSARR
ncbi:hypothetical protein L227DRAFT_420962 [Lentinus tigrinus ALCF2SS1-6]|uniref:Uncharacterized protein n=1 Tax=Lentinus tigrinus ALCF2SS1-6 TaxID=1328759 RepID=A0A5C2RSJ6_9APHY|nr:hypothetical protein L227DRAFT_420962 [Lentinus tigrinus ALCF2SS1-6]